MRRFLHILAMILIPFAVRAQGVVDAPPPAALVVAASTNASATRDGKSGPVTVGDDVYPGSVLEPGAGNLGLVFTSGEFFELKPGQNLRVGATLRACEVTDNATTRGIAQDEAITVSETPVTRSNHPDRLSQLAHISGIRGDAAALPVSPRLTISDPSPVFYWFDGDSTAVGQKRTYTITVRDAVDAVVAKKDVSGSVGELNSARLDNGSIKRIAEGHFRWTVTRQGESGTSAPSAAFVYVDSAGLSLADRRRTHMESLLDARKLDASSYHMLMALYYTDEKERLFSDAFPHLLELCSSKPPTPFACEMLAESCLRFTSQLAVVAAHLVQHSR